MKLVSLRCPNCHANVNTEIGERTTFFCPYCGSEVYVDDEVQRVEVNINHTYRKIDEARIEESRARQQFLYSVSFSVESNLILFSRKNFVKDSLSSKNCENFASSCAFA